MQIMDDTGISSPEPCSEKSCCKSNCCGLRVLLLVMLTGCVVLIVSSWRRTHNEIIGPPLLKADGKDLKATVISPHLEAAIEPGKNVLWCSTFQLVWNEGCRSAGGDIRLKNEPPMVAALNKKIGDEKDVDADSCLVMSGLVEKGIVGKIRRELDRKFQGQADPDLLNRVERDLPAQGWMAYAYLFRSLPFEYKFKRLAEPLPFGVAKVASFGLQKMRHGRDDYQIADQVAILDHKNDDDFIVALQPKDKSERIVLAKITPGETIQKTIEAVRARVKANWVDPQKAVSEEQRKRYLDQSLGFDESVVVPILDFELLQSYDELGDKEIATPGPLKGMPIVLAIQSIRFRLDEYGAVLKSQAGAAAKCAAETRKKPRQFVFDKPFLILLERQGAAQPYFALWVDNPELLTPWK